MYPIYVDRCGEMKMRMLKISNFFFFGVGGGGQPSVLPTLKRFFFTSSRYRFTNEGPSYSIETIGLHRFALLQSLVLAIALLRKQFVRVCLFEKTFIHFLSPWLSVQMFANFKLFWTLVPRPAKGKYSI